MIGVAAVFGPAPALAVVVMDLGMLGRSPPLDREATTSPDEGHEPVPDLV